MTGRRSSKDRRRTEPWWNGGLYGGLLLCTAALVYVGVPTLRTWGFHSGTYLAL